MREKFLMTETGDYVGLSSGKFCSKKDHYHKELLKGQIVSVDSVNNTGMYHLCEGDEEEENRYSFKRKYIGCIVSVETAHSYGELTVYYCHELDEYFSSNEIKII